MHLQITRGFVLGTLGAVALEVVLFVLGPMLEKPPQLSVLNLLAGVVLGAYLALTIDPRTVITVMLARGE